METISEIRRLRRMKFRHDEIMKQLEIPRSTYFKRLATIRKEDLRLVRELKGDGFATSLRLTIEGLEDCIRDCILLMKTSKRDSDKIAATELRYNIEIDLLNVQKLGPTCVSLPRRVYEVERLEELHAADDDVDDYQQQQRDFGPPGEGNKS